MEKETAKKPVAKKAEPTVVEVILNTENAVGTHTVYLADHSVEFVNGVSTVSSDVAKALKDAGITK